MINASAGTLAVGVIVADIMAVSSSAQGPCLVFRYQDNSNFYFVFPVNNTLILMERLGRAYYGRASGTLGSAIQVGVWYRIQIAATGGKISVYWNGSTTPTLEWTDATPWLIGKVRFLQISSWHTRWDNFTAWSGGAGQIASSDDFDPWGMVMEGRSTNQGITNARFKFTGKERDVESQYDYFGARYYDARIGRFLSVDPRTSVHPDYTPFAYVYNCPMRLVDLFGLDSTQRALAVAKALDYVAKNPGDSYPTKEQSKAGKFKGGPGELVDCAGVVNGCVVEGGEASVYGQGEDSGVKNVMAASERKGDKPEDLSKAQLGNALTLNNTLKGELDKAKDDKHTGVLVKLERDSNGKVLNASMAHSSGSAGSGTSGPRIDKLVINGKLTYWGRRITGVWKWDKKPD